MSCFEIVGRGNKSSCTRWCNDILEFIRGLYCNRCVVCKGAGDLEFAHLTETRVWRMGRGKYRRVRDILENPDKYTLLCDDCHKDFDSNIEDRQKMGPFIKSVADVAAKSEELQKRFMHYKSELPPIVA